MTDQNNIKPKGIKAKLENFWYHYKFHTIVVLVIVITLAVSITQCSTKTDYDYKIIIAENKVQLTSMQLDLMQKELAKYGEDLNGDGAVNVLLVDCTMGNSSTTQQEYMAKQQRLQTMIMSDTSVMMFITDEERYNFIINLGKSSSFIENIGLPEDNGRYYDLTGTHIIENPKKEIDPEGNLFWPELRISRRTVKGTLFEGRKGIEESVKNADEFIFKLVEATSK